ncbi:Altered inheritance of mitochondria protein 9 [Lachnellula arida]|uniref:Altered inheritance of mitochondria protein 9 n=1 Tax=Lachnellula arida TaxID=1316785 RepID=A0A8T9B4Z9_9HELO|nr:Altered inheritance of mitochondria protein 9 [Lachnellula arida]
MTILPSSEGASMGGDHHSSEEADLSMFAAVLSSMHLERLPDFASEIRSRNRHPQDKILPGKNGCSVVSPPLYGSYHILFTIKFNDGEKWLLKVPATGHATRHDRICASSLMSEAMTMRLLRDKTTILIPEVYSFDSSLSNALNCPYILMEYIVAIPLHELWFDNQCPKDLLEARRARALEEIAVAMVQMGALTYGEGGSLVFAEGERDPTIGPMRRMDMQAMLDRLKTDDSDETAIYCEVEPSKDPKAYFQSLADWSRSPADDYGKGLHHLLRHFIDWMPCSTHYVEPDFVLSHPDFDIQNVLVTPEGNLRALIDWDGVATVPRCVGNERYPAWLTRDWDPAKYFYNPEQGEDIRENSPEELENYRAMYRGFIGKAIIATRADKWTGDKEFNAFATITQNSLVIGSLEIAITDPVSMPDILRKVFNQLKCHVPSQPLSDKEEGDEAKSKEESIKKTDDEGGDESSDEDDFFLYDIAIALAAGELDDCRLAIIKSGFQAFGSETLNNQFQHHICHGSRAQELVEEVLLR